MDDDNAGQQWSTGPSEASEDERPLFERSLMAISDKSFAEQKNEQINDAVEKWLAILRLNPEASDTGRLLLEGSSIEAAKLGARRTIEATLGVRSKATAISRANAFLRFVNWREDELGKLDSSDVVEGDVWNYFCSLQDKHAAPTRAQSLLSAINYMRHVFGYEVYKPICESRRLSGLADVLYSLKAPLKQARVLTVDQVAWLHGRLSSPNVHHTDKAIVAYLLTALYGRCRHSDLCQVERVTADFDESGGFLEIQTRTHKTAKSAANKTVLLPIVVPAIGVTGQSWLPLACEAFAAVGLEFCGELNGPLYRPPSAAGDGQPCSRGITSTEVTRFLRACFENEKVDETKGRVSSHSLKATTLSWAGKACLGPADQAILGRHSSAYTETSAVYSRDNSIRAVAKLQDVTHAIHSKEFLPDCERSCYFARAAPVEQTEQPEAQTVKSESDGWSLVGKAELCGDQAVIDLEALEVASSSEESSCEDSGMESDEEKTFAPWCIRHVLSPQTAAAFVRHKVSKMVHFRDGEVGKTCNTLSCGRTLNGNYEAVNRFDTVDICKRCRVNAEKDGILGAKGA